MKWAILVTFWFQVNNHCHKVCSITFEQWTYIIHFLSFQFFPLSDPLLFDSVFFVLVFGFPSFKTDPLVDIFQFQDFNLEITFFWICHNSRQLCHFQTNHFSLLVFIQLLLLLLLQKTSQLIAEKKRTFSYFDRCCETLEFGIHARFILCHLTSHFHYIL